MNLENQFKNHLEIIKAQKTEDIWVGAAEALFNAIVSLFKKDKDPIPPSLLLVDGLDLRVLYEHLKEEPISQKTRPLNEYFTSLPGFDKNKSIFQQPTAVFDHHRWIAGMLVHILFYEKGQEEKEQSASSGK